MTQHQNNIFAIIFNNKSDTYRYNIHIQTYILHLREKKNNKKQKLSSLQTKQILNGTMEQKYLE